MTTLNQGHHATFTVSWSDNSGILGNLTRLLGSIVLRQFSRIFQLAICVAFAASLSAQRVINVPKDQPTIQAAINAAAAGDTVLVARGTYFENIDFQGKAITVTSSDGAGNTIIDGGGKGTAVTFQSAEPRTAILSNFTITHGGGFYSAYEDVGNGIYISNSQPTILNNIITANYCQNILVANAAPLIQGNTIANSAEPEKCFVLQNGGILVDGNLKSATYGGPSTPALIIGNTIENNTTGREGDGGDDGGAGIHADGGTPLILENIIRNNKAMSGAGGAIYATYASQVSVVGNLIYGNYAACGGGAISSWNQGFIGANYVLVANNTIVDNTAGLGGYSECRPTQQVEVDEYDGGGPDVEYVNNIFSGNTSYPSTDCGYAYRGYPNEKVDSEVKQMLFDHNLVFNAGGLFFATNCIDTTNLNGNVGGDPQFVNAAAHDYHLKVTSPAIDAGNGSILATLLKLNSLSYDKDLDGNPREQDATGKGFNAIDMGAYEFSGSSSGSPTRVVLSAASVIPTAGANNPLIATLSSSAGVPTGSVTFFVDGRSAGDAIIVNGVATLNPASFQPGIHKLLATYPGQGAFSPGESVIIFLQVAPYATSMQVSGKPNPSQLGGAVTITVSVSSTDPNAGQVPVSLYDSSGFLATVTTDASGSASWSTTNLTAGAHFVTAKYAGDTAHAPVQAYYTQTVVDPNQTMTTVISSANPSILGQPVTLTATVTSKGGNTPSGSVAFSAGSMLLGTQTTVVSSSPGLSRASITTSSIPLGYTNIVANYIPDTPFGASNGSLYQQVINGYPTTLNFSSAPNPSSIGEPVTLVARVSSANGTPTGSIQFADGASLLGYVPVDASGKATFSTPTLSAGGHTITATYSPTSNFAGSTATLTQQVNGIATYTSLVALPLNAAYGTTINFASDVISQDVTNHTTPTGTATLYANGTQVATGPLVNGNVKFSSSRLAVGTDNMTVAYSGDATFAASTSLVVPVTIIATATRLVISPHANPAPALLTSYYFTLSLFAGNTPLPNQPVTLTVPGYAALSATTDATGQAYFTTPFTLHTGNYALVGSFAGSTDYAPTATPPFPETIFPDRTTTMLTASATTLPQYGAVTLASTIVDVDTGNAFASGAAASNGVLNLYDGTTLLASTNPQGSSTMNATGQFALSNLSLGTHTLVATFVPASGDIATSSSAPVVLIVSPADFSLSLSQPTLTIQAEHHAAIFAGLSSTGGFTGKITVSCGALPSEATCTFDHDVLLLPANNAATAHLTVDTDAILNFKSANSKPDSFFRGTPARLSVALLLPLTLAGLARRRRTVDLLTLVILALAATGLSGCGNKYPAHTPPGTYAIKVSATGTPQGGTTPVTHTQTLTLVVTP